MARALRQRKEGLCMAEVDNGSDEEGALEVQRKKQDLLRFACKPGQDGAVFAKKAAAKPAPRLVR